MFIHYSFLSSIFSVCFCHYLVFSCKSKRLSCSCVRRRQTCVSTDLLSHTSHFKHAFGWAQLNILMEAPGGMLHASVCSYLLIVLLTILLRVTCFVVVVSQHQQQHMHDCHIQIICGRTGGRLQNPTRNKRGLVCNYSLCLFIFNTLWGRAVGKYQTNNL